MNGGTGVSPGRRLGKRPKPQLKRKKLRVFLVRHGQSEGNVDKKIHTKMADKAIPLTAAGQEQALAAGRWLRDYIDHRRKEDRTTFNKINLWVSSYLRTKQTAEGLMTGGVAPLIYKHREEPLLVEQQFGLFDGVAKEDLEKEFPREHAFYQKQLSHKGRFWAPMPLGESRFDVYQRCHQAFGSFQRDLDKHDVDNIIVVSHGTTNRAFTMAWLHLSPEWFDDEPRPNNCSIRLIEDSEDRGYIYKGFE
jgi:broad specificity phosphatase PhoE